MRRWSKRIGAALGVLLLVAGGAFLWARWAAAARLSRHYETHRVDFAIPLLLSDGELAALRAERAKALPPDAAPSADPLAGVDLKAVAFERARERGKHLAEARYSCVACHGADLGGGTMIDAPPIGHLYGMNLTSGKGGVVSQYAAADWDRTVRHGVLPDGRPTVMPADDYRTMSDQELSDLVAYVRSVPPVDREMARPTYGPVGTVLMATGKLNLSAESLDHQKPHAAAPPATGETAEFGEHLAQVCVGCHGRELTGGPIAGGDPSWPPASNLTAHADGLAGWTYDDFARALREGKSKDGHALREPMTLLIAAATKMTDTELKGMWSFIRSVPPKPSPK